jgi:hypothetical protein
LEFSKLSFTEQQLKKKVLRSLKRRAPVDILVFELCQKTGWNWKKSLDFVAAIQQEYSSEIGLLWAKVFSILGIACLGAGILITFYFIDVYVGLNYLFSCVQKGFESAIKSGLGTSSEVGCMTSLFMGLIQSLADGAGYLGIALMAGGLSGFILAQNQLKSFLQSTPEPKSE